MKERAGTRVENRMIQWAGEEPAHRKGKIGSLFEGNVLPLVIWHQDRRIRDANDAYLKLVGCSREEISNGTLRCDRLTPVEHLTRDEHAIEELRQGKAVCTPFQKEYIRHDGSRIPVLIGGALLPDCQDQGIAFALDLTKHSSVEQAVKARENAITLLYSAVLGPDRAQDLDKFTAGTATQPSLAPEPSALLAHEISQPLGTILANAQSARRLLRQRTPNLEELKAIVSDIIAEDRRATQLIDQVRLSTLLNRRTLHLANINAVVSEVLHTRRNELAACRIKNHLTLAPGLPMVCGDRGQLQQLFINLFSNARDALRQTAPAYRRLFTRTFCENESLVSIEVRDTGPGIPPGQLESIFQPFVSSKKGGMGIGLYICRAIVRFHGGRLWATNYPGGGACFHVSLPVATVR